MKKTAALKETSKVKVMIIIRAAVFTMVVTGYGFIGNAHAISPENHRPVTRVAISAYKACTEQLAVKDTLSEGIEAIVEFSKLEDESPLIKRYFNWHFYDAYNDTEYAMGESATGARKSLHHIYDEHAEQLIEALEKNRKEDIYEYTGRLLHLIQDMAVPAHVAPIYHYKFLWFDQSDYFDEMPEWNTSPYTKPEELCRFDVAGISDMKEKLNVILDDAALGTRNRIREKILVDDGHRLTGKTWQEFWVIRNPDDDSRYSGTKYGFAPYGNEGREGFRKLCETSGSDREVCLNFFKQSFDSAVTSTVRTLLLVNSIKLGNMKGDAGK